MHSVSATNFFPSLSPYSSDKYPSQYMQLTELQHVTHHQFCILLYISVDTRMMHHNHKSSVHPSMRVQVEKDISIPWQPYNRNHSNGYTNLLQPIIICPFYDARISMTPVPPRSTVRADIIHISNACQKICDLPHLDVIGIINKRSAINSILRMKFVRNRGVINDDRTT